MDKTGQPPVSWRGGRPWIVIRDRWEVVGGQAVNCLRTSAREFRYDSGRARYLMRDLDLATLQPPAAYAGLWTDYAQDTACGDYTLSPGANGPEADTLARYQPGAWERQGDALRVHHGDQIGSSRFMTDASAQTARRAVYTAFGELVLADDGHGGPPAASRYGYAGAWGYETGLDDGGEPDLPPLPFLHVGERWYDPSTGRFLQRDPIGIRGGLNVFAYVESSPVTGIDPTGRFNDWAFGELPSGWKPGGLTSPPTPPSSPPKPRPIPPPPPVPPPGGQVWDGGESAPFDSVGRDGDVWIQTRWRETRLSRGMGCTIDPHYSADLHYWRKRDGKWYPVGSHEDVESE